MFFFNDNLGEYGISSLALLLFLTFQDISLSSEKESYNEDKEAESKTAYMTNPKAAKLTVQFIDSYSEFYRQFKNEVHRLGAWQRKAHINCHIRAEF